MAKVTRRIEALDEWQFDTWLRTRKDRRRRLDSLRNNAEAWNSTTRIINQNKRR